MSEFLRSIAKAHIDSGADLSDYCFVFPNKRAGTFFRKYLGEESAEAWMVSPEITTISDFVTELSGRVAGSRLDLLFILYREYCGLMRDKADFDKFRVWGEMVLSDFNDVDMYEVNPDALFKNLSDLREIRTDYFTPEQLEVLRDYFGITEYEEETRSFWLHYNNPDAKESSSRNKRRFIELWKVLAELYHNFNRTLDEGGIAYAGAMYRLALERLRSEGTAALPGRKRIVMVGFNALSTVEYNIFRELQKLTVEGGDGNGVPFADFYWDCTGAPMSDERNSAVHFVHKNIRKFPSLLDISESATTGLPEKLKVYSSPSNSAQAKIVNRIVNEIRGRVGDDEIDKARVAVVLPDEGLLLPVMYSLPEDMPGVNLTMGYPMRLTSTVTFVELLRKLQRRKRKRPDGKYEFFHEDVSTLLTHAFVQNVAGAGVCQSLREAIAREHLYLIPVERIMKSSEVFAIFFQPLERDASSFEVLEYLDTSLDAVERRMGMTETSSLVKNRLDLSHIRLYRQGLSRLYDAFSLYGVKAKGENVFSLADSLIRGETVRFEGEPLEGLQIMGPLETRCLDFDYLIIPSMNERIYPRKLKGRTFIPNSLRKGYGMATTRFQESIFAYNFYRMISRAKQVHMIYDARSSGLKTGDVSRYIRQLSLLYAPGKVDFTPFSFRISKSEEEIRVKKTPEVMSAVEKYFRKDTGKFFSASALSNYLSCPLRFYLENVRGLSVTTEPEEFMEAWVIGTVLHSVLENIYTPLKSEQNILLPEPKNITEDFLRNVIADKDNIRRLIRNAINQYHYNRREGDRDLPLESDGEVYAEIFEEVIGRILSHDMKLTPFLYYGSEIKDNEEWKLSDGSVANMKMVIDRLDGAGDDNGGKYRIVDYKSGYYNIDAKSVADLFDGGKGHKAFFQLMLYACLLMQKLKIEDGVRMEIYDLSQIGTSKSRQRPRIPSVAGEKLESGLTIENAFRENLDAMLLEIKDESKDFTQCSERGHCHYCPFRNICRR